MSLKALFYPDVPFETLYIPYIYKEIYFDGIYIDILNGRTDMTIVDVGANIGIVTDHMRPHAKKIYSIEPLTKHFEALQKNKEFNGWDNVEIFNMAIAGKDGEVIMHECTNNMTSTSYATTWEGETETVKAQAMDTFFKENNIEKVDFMKFDVEGAEDDILRSDGFKKVADKIKAIEIEFHYPTWIQLAQYLESLGYKARRYPCDAVVVLFTR